MKDFYTYSIDATWNETFRNLNETSAFKGVKQ